MSEYELPGVDDSGTMETTDTVPAADDASPGPGLDFAAEIHFQLSGINQKLAQQQSDDACKEQERLAAIPNRVVFNAASNATTAWRALSYAGPQLGRQWHVRGAAAAVAASTVAAAYVFIGTPAAINVDPTTGPALSAFGSLRAVLTANPAVAAVAGQWAPGPLEVKPGEVVVVAVTATAGTPLVITSITVDDEPLAARKTRPVVET